MLGENENYKYLGILEADTIKQTKTKEGEVSCTILKIDKGRIQTKGLKTKGIGVYARDDIDCACQENKEDDSPALMTA